MNALPTQEELVTFNTGEVAGKWFARIRNTENGRNWIQQFRDKNRKLKVTTYGRSPNRRSRCVDANRHYYPNFHSPKISETIVLYIERNTRRCEDVKVNESMIFRDENQWEIHYTVKEFFIQDDVKHLIAFCYEGRIVAKWSDKKQLWVEIKVA